MKDEADGKPAFIHPSSFRLHPFSKDVWPPK
jgi:hypothetical protein